MEIGGFAIFVAVSLLLAFIPGILDTRAVHRRSADLQAALHLFISLLAGIGFGVLLFVIGISAGIALDSILFVTVDCSFGAPIFSFVILIPTLVAIFSIYSPPRRSPQRIIDDRATGSVRSKF